MREDHSMSRRKHLVHQGEQMIIDGLPVNHRSARLICLNRNDMIDSISLGFFHGY